MPDFISQRNALNQARADHESSRLNLSAINARIKLLKQEQSKLRRALNADNTGNNQRLAALEERMEELQGEAKKAASEAGRASARLKELNAKWIEVESLTDPREQLSGHFQNTIPFLLFPTRMEIRFKSVLQPETGRAVPQLWVRIYPDTCMVDSFDPQLSAQEVRNAARFWAEYYAAGQPVDATKPDAETLARQKAAWAFLVRVQGAGRAAWIAQAQEAKPLAGSVFPSRDSDKTIILTIATEDKAILANQAAIFDFFSKLWKTGADENEKAAVKDGFPSADQVIEKYLPINFDDPLPAGVARAEADLKIALVLLPEAVQAAGKTHSWSQAARVSIAPERFVLLGYNGDNPVPVIEELGKPIATPLMVGFDPRADEKHNFSPTASGDLNIPEELKWIIDFDEAVSKGMGFRVNLTEQTKDGVDRLLCLGVRLSADETEKGGQQLVSQLFKNHFYSDKGFSVVPQGTPTNNTEEMRSCFTDLDNPDETFELYLKQKPAFVSRPDWQDKADGQWLSEWLGLDESLFQKVLHAERMDQADAINMNCALWPGTFGYGMEAMMSPVFPESVIEATREFFCMFVTGRGSIPAVRIASQPYGILPTAAFRRMQWMKPGHQGTEPSGHTFKRGATEDLDANYIDRLYQLLVKIEADWCKLMIPQIPHAGADNPQDTHQHLLDIVGLHPNSVEFYYRYMQTLETLYSYATLAFPFEEVKNAFDKMEFGTAYQLLKELGYNPGVTDALPLLSKLYGLDFNWQHKIVIDSVPLSESSPIRSYTEDNRNYIEALLDAASTSMDALRKNGDLSETPQALLFKLLKFSLEQGYFDTAVRLHQDAAIFTAQQAAAVRTEKPFLHMNWQGEMVKSRYALLYKHEDRIASGVSVADHIAALVAKSPDFKLISPVHYLQIAAVGRLKGASTARLERALVEHLDCCSYRLDAWQQGILRLQLMLMRNNHPPAGEGLPVQPKKGIYIGAFGWLENVRPEKDKVLNPVEVPEALKEDFTASYLSDSANAGYIHAPSVNQAVSAAVLRNAFLTNGKSDNNSELAVNLSSERIRLALSMIEGIQNGQTLPALLGYKFERMLHDQKEMKDKKIDTYVYALRKQFPLNADRIADTQVKSDPSVDPDTIPISAIEARNVVHGKRLVDHVREQTGANKSYPFGFGTEKLPPADAEITKAITDAVNHIMNVEDAVADLAMAESVHQVCQGNYDRAAGVLESYSTGNYPQTPDVIRTPRSGPTLSHRVSIQMEFVPRVPFDALHPRKSAEPTLNQWLSAMLPAMDKLICHVNYSDRTDNSVKREPVSMQDIKLEPIDLLYLLDTTGDAALTAIDEHVLHFVYSSKTPMLDTEIKIEYVARPEDASTFSLFEVMSLVRSIRSLVLESRSLKPSDMLRSSEASTKTETLITLDKSRSQDLTDGLKTVLDGTFTTKVLNILKALPEEPTAAEKETIRKNIDQYLTDLFAELEKLRRFGLPQSGSGHLYQRRAEIIKGLQKKIQDVSDRFEKKSHEYDDLAAAFDNTAPDAIEQLQKMEALVSTKYSNVDVITETIVSTKKTSFDKKLDSLRDVLQPNAITGIFVLFESIRIQITDVGDFDFLKVDLSDVEEEIVRFVLNDLRPLAQGAFDLGKKRQAKAAKLMVDLATKGPQEQVDLIQLATQSILGDEFKLVPRYELDVQQAFEVSSAWNSADLLSYLKNDHSPPFLDPVEDWMHGIARVREKMHHAENCIFLREALGLDAEQLTLHPIQLPYKDEEYHWMAMPFPQSASVKEGDILLYTALTSAAPTPAYACGCLIDEWTEVIPTEKETTGLTFHYDRPNSEAPQAFLLVMPTQLTGNWEWHDLVDALRYTLDAARLRAVEPHHIDQTSYARYLPAVLSPTNRHPITIGMYLAELPLMATANQ